MTLFPEKGATVGVVMGSQSDWPVMRTACEVLEALGVDNEFFIVSAHRTFDRLDEYGKTAASRGVKVIIAGAGGAAHLPGMLASHTHLPVIGVPIKTSDLNGMDSLLSIVQMPKGVPVGTMAIGEKGAVNAGLYAARMLALADTGLEERLRAYIAKMTAEVPLKPV